MKNFLFIIFILEYFLALFYFASVAMGDDFVLPVLNFSKQKDLIEERMGAMTLEEKVGQIFIFGFWGEDLNENIKNLISNYHIGGVILLKYNLGNDAEVKTLNEALQNFALNSEQHLPLFISIDQEGGVVSRLKTVNSVAQSDITTKEMAAVVAEKRGQELRNLGINVNYAPVLDFVNKSDSFLYDRVFTGAIELRNELGVAMVNAYQAQQIVPVIKHFPGHPDDKIDSHKALPTSSMSKSEVLYKAQSFQAALNNGPMMVMSGHIAYPQVDENYPASLSSIFLNDILRKDWDYDGVIITDDLEMGALQNNFSNAEIARLAFLAGNDILLYSSTLEKQLEAYETILLAVQSGKITEERLDESVYRILKLKYQITNN